jgi:hypothetical protein
MEQGMSQGMKDQMPSIVRSYPIKKRAIFALSTCAALLLATLNWKFEPAKTIAICAIVVGCLFDIRGRWSMLFFGIGIGDLLLYVSK